MGSNNYSEILALLLLLILEKKEDVKCLQVFGDSQLVIDWDNDRKECHNLGLSLILAEIKTLKASMENISFSHISRDKNAEADLHSKAGLELRSGQWIIQKVIDVIFYGIQQVTLWEIVV